MNRKELEVLAAQKLLTLPQVGVTAICDFLESPKHYHYKRILKKREETPAMREGTIFHRLILEPEKFYQEYFTDMAIPEGVTSLKTVDDLKQFIESKGQKPKGKKEDLMTLASALLPADGSVIIYDDWIELNTRDKEFISKGKWDMFHEMRESVMAHKFTKRYLEFGKKELLVEGEIQGFHVRGRIDWLVDEPSLPYVIVIDPKKCASAKFHMFRNDILNRWYFVQAALYCKLIEMQYKKPVLHVWMACESTGPKIVEAYSANEAVLEAGEKAYTVAFNRLRTCLELDEWAGYTDGNVTNMDLPNYGFDKVAEMEMQSMEDGE